jgi:hypothetical protein
VCANGQERLAAAMLCWILLPAAAKTAQTPVTEAGRPTMTIRIHDYASVPDKTLRQAFEEAQRIFRVMIGGANNNDQSLQIPAPESGAGSARRVPHHY